MEKDEYEIMFNMEDNYWWYVGLRKLVLSFIIKFSRKYKNEDLRILDAGCGTGKVLEDCKIYQAYGLEISEEAIKFCKRRSLNNVIRASICDIPFANQSFNIVISLDVLYHSDIKNDIKVLEELCRVVDKRGMLLLNLPAYDFLQSEHDRAIHTRHRYTRKELKKKVEGAGFKIEKITYRNVILFPLILIIRLGERVLSKKRKEAKSDLRPLPDLINKFLTGILFLENRLISVLNYPFGLSLFCIAKKE